MPRALHKQYQKQWTKAKEEYHTATGSKRPGENRLWGLFGDRFQKSTEIGDACKLVDDALENITDKKTGLATKKGIDKAKEALANLTAKKDTYLTRLDRDLEVEGTKLAALLAKETSESRKSLTIAEKKQDAKAVKAAEKALDEAEKKELEHAAAMKAAKSKKSALETLKSALNRWPRELDQLIDAFAAELVPKPKQSDEDLLKAMKAMVGKGDPSGVIRLSDEIEKACQAILKEKTEDGRLQKYKSSLYGDGNHALMRRLGALLETLRKSYPPEQKEWQKVFDKYGNANAGGGTPIEAKDVEKAVKKIAVAVGKTKNFGTAMKKEHGGGM